MRPYLGDRPWLGVANLAGGFSVGQMLEGQRGAKDAAQDSGGLSGRILKGGELDCDGYSSLPYWREPLQATG